MYAEKQLLQDIAQWCINHRVHLVVNEIYGLVFAQYFTQ
jgi:hypothetical protein